MHSIFRRSGASGVAPLALSSFFPALAGRRSFAGSWSCGRTGTPQRRRQPHLITAEDLEERQTYVADILREVPGVAVIRQGPRI